jgi:hypothetical protein
MGIVEEEKTPQSRSLGHYSYGGSAVFRLVFWRRLVVVVTPVFSSLLSGLPLLQVCNAMLTTG